ncbi:hypothetical protein [Paludisphaera mucosa]|uniref:Uncharacterized protein n=1 Tax=Paludisphaera mucosa TaxID=3030827 RepID=A0ABT6F6J8_9BACT|nr:hypothetical protein [Paludisphaera mucosa]MDG3003152.1 hypothetical protein [Paludisphaera mucosa]
MLNVLVLDGLSILGSALAMRRWGGITFDVDPLMMKKVLFGSLFAVFVVAMFVLRRTGGRERLEDPQTRGARFFGSRVAAVAIGWAAFPLGLAHGLLFDPNLQAVAPFWLAAMVLGKLAYPRADDLEGFDEPMAAVDEGSA